MLEAFLKEQLNDLFKLTEVFWHRNTIFRKYTIYHFGLVHMVYFLKNGQNREFRALALPFELIAINEVLSFDSVYYKNLFKLMSKLLID